MSGEVVLTFAGISGTSRIIWPTTADQLVELLSGPDAPEWIETRPGTWVRCSTIIGVRQAPEREPDEDPW